jgi:chemotaxis protein methyltransferase CheR
LGISETSTVKHPLLENRCLKDVFFFQKINLQKSLPAFHSDEPEKEKNTRALPDKVEKPVPPKLSILPVDCKEVKAIFEIEEGQFNAKKILKSIGTESASLSGSELAAAASHFLNVQDFSSADLVLSHLEKTNTCAHVLFLRGEYHLLQGKASKAKDCFENAAGKDRAFWPAFYRIASSAAEGNPAQYEYKVKKASESIKQGRDSHYECFMGGFSPDYFERILTKKLSTTKFKEYV